MKHDMVDVANRRNRYYLHFSILACLIIGIIPIIVYFNHIAICIDLGAY